MSAGDDEDMFASWQDGGATHREFDVTQEGFGGSEAARVGVVLLVDVFLL